MSFGSNLQFMRKMHNGMTQEELAEELGVSRQAVSKWEKEDSFPEMDKALTMCELFNCSLDELLRQDINSENEAYKNIRIETMEKIRYFRYAVVSSEPEDDAKNHMLVWAGNMGVKKPVLIGWDFPVVSQEQINVFHMHGYCSACIIGEDELKDLEGIITQPAGVKYIAITIENPFENPFVLIPGAYKTLMRYMDVNGIHHRQDKDIIECFEKEYAINGTQYMDVYIAI